MKYKLAMTTAAGALIANGGLLTPASAQDSAANDAFEIEEVIVTAQRRAESLQSVPVAVSAFSAADIETKQIRGVLDLQRQVPNVVITNGTGTANSARIFFRGIGEDESRGAIDPAVGIYVDGIYLGRTVGSLLDVVDVERIEVLRGPQGTLYGRNSNGGAVKLVSIQPQQENSFDAEAGFGSDGRINLRGTANFELGDATAARVTSLYSERDGFHQINPNGDLADEAREAGAKDVFAIRGSLKHAFNENWSALLSFDFTKDKSDPVPSSIIAESDDPSVVTDADGDIFTVEPAPGTTCSSAVPLTFRPVGCFTAFDSDIEAFGGSLKIDGRLGEFDLTLLSGYRTLNDSLSSHINFPFFQETDQDQFSQEVTLSSDFDGPFNFVSGVFYYKEDVALDTTFIFPFSVGVDTEAIAVFGQGTYDLTERLTFTGGVRYTNENRDFTGSGPGGTRDESLETDNVTYTTKLDYQINDNLLVYGSFATGFKSPGFSPDCFGPTACFLPVEEEKVETFEAGLRADTADKMMRFNATYFYNNYDNLQISATVPDLGFTRSNAGTAKIQGIEVETTLYATENLQFFANASWLDAEYDSLTELQAATLTNNGASCPGGVATVECALDLELKGAPPFKITVGFLADFEVNGGRITLGGDAAYEDDSFALVANPPGSLSEPGVTLNARASYQPEDGAWRVTVWGKNLTDREFFRAATGLNNVYAMPPMTWGVDLGVSF